MSEILLNTFENHRFSGCVASSATNLLAHRNLDAFTLRVAPATEYSRPRASKRSAVSASHGDIASTWTTRRLDEAVTYELQMHSVELRTPRLMA